MFYSIRHTTQFVYSAPVSESLTEVRMQPRTEAMQRCLGFELGTNPRAKISAYRDRLGNAIHHFDVPVQHSTLRITAESRVECLPPAELPDRLDDSAWNELDDATREGGYWDFLTSSTFVVQSQALSRVARELDAGRRSDPLTLLRDLNQGIFSSFDYRPESTQVDSPIDHALEERQGVCQDFAHIMLALVRPIGIPSRYVSGYLFHGVDNHDRSDAGASHAWVEAWLPGLGWTGFDPTNNLIAAERHVKAAIGRDYADVPPTRGVFKGRATSELSVAVQVALTDSPPPHLEMLPGVMWTSTEPDDDEALQQQQQQQQ
jgi:transglutaminase-like putative cysteine protease